MIHKRNVTFSFLLKSVFPKHFIFKGKKIKETLKKNFPLLFNLLKNLYINTVYYRNKLEKLRKIQEANNKKREQEKAKIMNDVFNNEYIVQNGHFKGMKYIKRSSGSALLPKILGSYEEPIQGWIYEILEDKKYKNILDIGCAEGCHACGFAMRLPNTTITAYDIDEKARKNLNELKQINKLANIEIKAECTYEELNLKSKPNILIFCDIEGFEKTLLDPVKVANLKYVDLLIESHDCFVPNITEELIERFYLTHTMRIIVDYPYRVKNYVTPKVASKEQIEYITNENRILHMKFIYMESVNEKL